MTGNVLIGFDPHQTRETTLLHALESTQQATAELPKDGPPPPVVSERQEGSMCRARIAVRGLDRDPRVARRVVQRLRKLFPVRVQASMLTGRILVEYDENQVDLHDLLSRVAEVELPDLPGEDRPAHPLDLGPLLHAAARTLGAALGLGLIAGRRLAGRVVPPSRARAMATATGIIGLLRSFPSLRNGLRRLLGRNAADLVFSTASVVTLTFSGSPLGLTVTGLEGLLLLRAVRARRSAWRRFEERLQGAAAEPGAVIRLEAGERIPLEAQVIEGTGTAIGRDGLPRRIGPGATVAAGAELAGGPFTLQLQGGSPFLPQPRPVPLNPTLYSRYLYYLSSLSLGYAALTALLTRSVGRTFNALLLVNPRTAMIGMEAANLDAAARVLRGGILLQLSREEDGHSLGLVALQPRLSEAGAHLAATCCRLHVRLEMLRAGSPSAAQSVARRAEIALVPSSDAEAVIRQRQQAGKHVVFVSDSAQAAPAFAACDLAIGLAPASTGDFPARADLLAPDLDGVVAVLEAGARRDRAVRDAVGFSAGANVFGAIWGFQGRPGVLLASYAVYVTALVALADGWLRLRGGKRAGLALTQLVDPRPERWGQQSTTRVLRELGTSERGLTSAQAAQRLRAVPRSTGGPNVLNAVLEQVRSPVNGILTGGALLSLIAGGAALDIVIIGATVAVNVVVGVWQERQAGKAVEALKRLGSAKARVLRQGKLVTLLATDLVPGDVLVLAAGDQVAADARLLSAQDLEVDEAALTGESVPVPKRAEAGPPESRIVLEGSGVVVGTGQAVVVAVGRQTRLGATAAALDLEEPEESPFGERLARLLQLALPIAAGGGVTVMLAGLLWRKPLVPQLSVAASIALAVVPESLPLLAGTGQVGASRRLAGRHALLRRLSAVEALGRVDVACSDKTGTLTEGRLAVGLVADADREARVPGALDGNLRQVLLTAALASPHPGAADATAHPTDVAVIRAAHDAGLGDEIKQERRDVDPFEPAQSFHSAVVRGRLCVKGSPEELSSRCTRLHRLDADLPLDEAGRQALLDQAHDLAGRGLRVLMVAEGKPNGTVEEPKDLTALGFVGIRDPLRPTVPAAVSRCHEAGVRVIMITGDHPATARAIAQEAGLFREENEILTAADLTELPDAELDQRLERTTVIARATPHDWGRSQR